MSNVYKDLYEAHRAASEFFREAITLRKIGGPSIVIDNAEFNGMRALERATELRSRHERVGLGRRCPVDGCTNDTDPRWFAHDDRFAGEPIMICDGHFTCATMKGGSPEACVCPTMTPID